MSCLTSYTHLSELNPSPDVLARMQSWYPHRLPWPRKPSTERGKVQGMMMTGSRQTGGKVVESWTRGASLSPRKTDCLCPHPLLLIESPSGVEGRQVFRMSTTVSSDTGLLNKEQVFKNQFCSWRWLSVIKGTCCACRGSWFVSQHPHPTWQLTTTYYFSS